MIDVNELTDAALDAILERFDKTDPKLQRRIIAKFVADRSNLLEAARALILAAEEEGWDHYRGTDEPKTGMRELRAAVAKAEGRSE